MLTADERIRRLEDALATVCDTLDDLAWDGVIGTKQLKPIKEFMITIYNERDDETPNAPHSQEYGK